MQSEYAVLRAWAQRVRQSPSEQENVIDGFVAGAVGDVAGTLVGDLGVKVLGDRRTEALVQHFEKALLCKPGWYRALAANPDERLLEDVLDALRDSIQFGEDLNDELLGLLAVEDPSGNLTMLSLDVAGELAKSLRRHGDAPEGVSLEQLLDAVSDLPLKFAITSEHRELRQELAELMASRARVSAVAALECVCGEEVTAILASDIDQASLAMEELVLNREAFAGAGAARADELWAKQATELLTGAAVGAPLETVKRLHSDAGYSFDNFRHWFLQRNGIVPLRDRRISSVISRDDWQAVFSDVLSEYGLFEDQRVVRGRVRDRLWKLLEDRYAESVEKKQS